jgi:hypothetical protein
MIHYGFVDIAIKQETRDLLRDLKKDKSYNNYIKYLISLEEKEQVSDEPPIFKCGDCRMVFDNFRDIIFHKMECEKRGT